jgi:hypothetical protein
MLEHILKIDKFAEFLEAGTYRTIQQKFLDLQYICLETETNNCPGCEDIG